MSSENPVQTAVLVVGLGHGDEGKGRCVDATIRESPNKPDLVIRFNGGPQAAHHVVSPDGRRHCFSQLGAGSFIEGVGTALAAPVAFDPLSWHLEARVLAEAGVPSHPFEPGLFTVDPRCVVVTPYHRILNRLMETQRGSGRHGSCGMGVGVALLDAERGAMPVVRAAELFDADALLERVSLLRLMTIDRAEQLIVSCDSKDALAVFVAALENYPAELYVRSASAVVELLGASACEHVGARLERHAHIVCEGAQGVLLDRYAGYFPYCTPSATTGANARALLADSGREVRTIGALRAYATRHGAGPLTTECPALLRRVPSDDNQTGPWQGPMRVGWFDAVAARYGVELDGHVDEVALTNADRIAGLGKGRVARAYEYRGPGGELERYFDVERSHGRTLITRLKVLEAPSLAALTARTELLSGCQPVYDEVDLWPRFDWRVERPRRHKALSAFVELLERPDVLGKPVRSVGFGPRATDTLWLSETSREDARTKV